VSPTVFVPPLLCASPQIVGRTPWWVLPNLFSTESAFFTGGPLFFGAQNAGGRHKKRPVFPKIAPCAPHSPPPSPVSPEFCLCAPGKTYSFPRGSPRFFPENVPKSPQDSHPQQ